MTDVLQRRELLETTTIALIVVAILFFIIAVVIWFVCKIPHSIQVLTKIGSHKDIYKNTTINSPRKSDAVLSWTTSEILKNKVEEQNTMLLDDSEATVLLNNETVLLDEKDTGFKIEEEVMVVSSDESL